MKINATQTAPENYPKNYSKNKKRSYLKTLIVLFVGVAIIFGVSLFTYKTALQYFPTEVKTSIKAVIRDFVNRQGGNNDSMYSGLKKSLLNLPERIINNYIDSYNATVDEIHINIKFKHLQKLSAKRNEALKKGILIQGSDDYVPATIQSKHGEIKVKLRLKGDWVDHLKGKKWSFRIHTKGKSELFGLRRFSIQSPNTRGFQGEALIHEVFDQFKILAPQYYFVDVFINGDNIGIMALEEHFSKELLERNGRKEGVIIRFDESLLWQARVNNEGPNFDKFYQYFNAEIRAFQSSKIKKSTHLSREYGIAVGLLRGFVEGQLTASEVFDVDLMGRYLAITQFFGAWHEIIWHNQRFYLNPLTLKLEPIAFDADTRSSYGIGVDVMKDKSFNIHLLKDKKIAVAFKKTLILLKENTLNGSLPKTLQAVEAPLLKILRKEYLLLPSFNYKKLKQRALNQPHLKTTDNTDNSDLNANVGALPQYIHAFLVKNNQQPSLELLNILPYKVQVQAINWVDKRGNKKPFKPIEPLKYPIILSATKLKEQAIALVIPYPKTPLEEKFHLEITSNIKGNPISKTSRAKKYFTAFKQAPIPTGNINALAKNPYISLMDNNTVLIKKGHWQVKENIIIPSGYRLKITADTHLQFTKDASMIIYGSTHFQGTADKPIVLTGIDNHTWQGLVVFQANARSRWSYVNIKNTSGIDFPLWKLSGGTTFYQSDVDIKNSVFSGNRGEDALNIIHADFTLDKVDIINTQSDGFDGDFVSGTINAGLFQDIGKIGGGDGVDISGSQVSLTATAFNRISDKAISVGENSQMSVFNARIKNVSIGAASKDSSSLKINNTQINNASGVALMAYVKKTEYGPASLIAEQVKIINAKQDAIVQQGSSLELNGKVVATKALNVKQLYQTIMKPGLKK